MKLTITVSGSILVILSLLFCVRGKSYGDRYPGMEILKTKRSVRSDGSEISGETQDLEEIVGDRTKRDAPNLEIKNVRALRRLLVENAEADKKQVIPGKGRSLPIEHIRKNLRSIGKYLGLLHGTGMHKHTHKHRSHRNRTVTSSSSMTKTSVTTSTRVESLGHFNLQSLVQSLFNTGSHGKTEHAESADAGSTHSPTSVEENTEPPVVQDTSNRMKDLIDKLTPEEEQEVLEAAAEENVKVSTESPSEDGTDSGAGTGGAESPSGASEGETLQVVVVDEAGAGGSDANGEQTLGENAESLSDSVLDASRNGAQSHDGVIVTSKIYITPRKEQDGGIATGENGELDVLQIDMNKAITTSENCPDCDLSKVQSKFASYKKLMERFVSEVGNTCPDIHGNQLLSTWATMYHKGSQNYREIVQLSTDYAEDLKLRLEICLQTSLSNMLSLPETGNAAGASGSTKKKRELEAKDLFESKFNAQKMNLVNMFARLPEMIQSAPLI